MDTMTTTVGVGANALKLATAYLPGWLADAVAAWVRDQEERGHGFTGAAVAVRDALDTMKGH